MKRYLSIGFCILLVMLSVAGCFNSRSNGIYPVSFTYPGIVYADDSRHCGGKQRLIEVLLWYPTKKDVLTESLEYGFWKIKGAAMNAPISLEGCKLPLVLFSHGYGGDLFGNSWFAHYLASHGYIVASIKHCGNTFGDVDFGISARPWNRPLDIKVALDKLLADPRFNDRIDMERIGAAGFSQGGMTALWLAGVRADVNQEMIHKHINTIENAEWRSIFEGFTQADIDDANVSYRDNRIKAVFAMAPGIDFDNWLFTRKSFSDVSIPVDIIVGDADKIVSADENAIFFAQQMPKSSLTVLRAHVGHWVFMNEATHDGQKANPGITVDYYGIDRAYIHQQVGKRAIEFFNAAMP